MIAANATVNVLVIVLSQRKKYIRWIQYQMDQKHMKLKF